MQLPTVVVHWCVLRFKQIASVAASRVETTRDLLVNWSFFMETKVASQLTNSLYYFCF